MQYLKNIRVAIRLPFVVILALVALVVFALVSLSTMGTVRIGGDMERDIAQQSAVITDLAPPTAYLVETELAAMEMRVAWESGDTASVDATIPEIAANVDAFHRSHETWAAEVPEGSTAQAVLAEVLATGDAYVAVLRQQMIPAIQQNDTAAIEAAEAELDRLFDAHRATANQAVERLEAENETDAANAIDLASGRQKMLWTLLVATLLVVGVAAAMVTMSILKPLDELRDNMAEIASGEGEAADARLDADRRDEFGQVASAFNAFADRLVAYADEVAANARAAESRAVGVSQAANVAAENMNTVAVATTELSAAASEIARSAGDASRTAETAVQAADHANALMQRLADSSARIGQVVESIRGIAAQTTMLALNATIEAARAGEAGRGFAVVASEVKDLAAETGSATADIVGRVEAIESDTRAALVALGEVGQVITEISSSQSVIAAAVEEQAATTAEIDRSLTEAVTAVNQLASRTGATGAPVHDGHFTTAA